MDNVLIEINKKTRQVFLTNSVIGNDGENLQENLVFSFNDEFVDGTGRLELIKPDKEKSYIMLEKIDETYQIPVKSIITKGGRLTMQLVITQGTDPNAIPIFKSNKFYVVINSSINFLIEEPDEYPQWIDVANTKLNEIDEAILEASNLNIDVNKEDNVATITLTDKEGQTKEVEILDGERGPQGIQGETGPAGVDGIDGKDATINGVNVINIVAGENITLEQDGSTLTINSEGGDGKVKSVNGKTGDVVLKTSDLQNDSGFISEELEPQFNASASKNITNQDVTNWNAKSDFSGDYNDLTNKPTIPTVPTNVSAFTNDAGYLTQHQDISGKQDTIQYSTMPTASSENVGKIVQYTGTTDNTYTNGYFYIGTTDGTNYSWEELEVQPSGSAFVVEEFDNTNGTEKFDFTSKELGIYIARNPEKSCVMKFSSTDEQNFWYYATNITLQAIYYYKNINDVGTNTYFATATGFWNYNNSPVYVHAGMRRQANGTCQIVIFNFSGRNINYLSTTAQSIVGAKTFTTIPKQNNTTAPTKDAEFTNKKYVDDSISNAIGSINTILATLTTPGGNE